MSEESLFGGKSKSSEKGLFDEPKSNKKPKSVFDAPHKETSSKDKGIFADESKKGEERLESTASPAPRAMKKTVGLSHKSSAKKIRNILIISIVAIFLLGGGIAAAIWAMWYNSDEGIFATALKNLFDSNRTDIVVDGNLKVEGDSEDEQVDISFSADILTKDADGKFDVSFDAAIPQNKWVPGKTIYRCPGNSTFETYSEAYATCGYDYEYEYERGYYDSTTEEFSFSGSLITIADDGYYFQVGLTNFLDFIGENIPELEDYDNEWLFISQDYLSELMDDEFDTSELQACIEEVANQNSKASDEIYDLIFKSNLVKAVAEKPEKRKGDLIRYTLEFSKDIDDYAQFVKDLYSLDVMNSMLDCYADNIDGFDRSDIDDQFEEMIGQLEGLTSSERKEFSDAIREVMPKFTIVIDRVTRQVTGLEIHGDFDGAKFTFDMGIKANSRPNETIKAPNDFKDIKEILD